MLKSNDEIDAYITGQIDKALSKKEHLVSIINIVKLLIESESEDSFSYSELASTLIEEIENVIPLLTDLIDGSNTISSSAKVLCDHFKSKVAKLKQKKFALNNENFTLKQEMQSIKYSFDKLQSDFELLSNEYYDMIAKHQSLSSFHDDNSDSGSNDKEKEMENHIAQMKQEATIMTESLSTLEYSNALLKEENKQLKGSIQSLMNGFDNRFILRSLSEKKITEKNEEINQLSKEFECLEYRYKRLNEENSDLKAQIQDYNKQLYNIKNSNYYKSTLDDDSERNEAPELISYRDTITNDNDNMSNKGEEDESCLINNISFTSNDNITSNNNCKADIQLFTVTPKEIINSMNQNEFKKILVIDKEKEKDKDKDNGKRGVIAKYKGKPNKLYCMMIMSTIHLNTPVLQPSLYVSLLI